MTTIKLVKLIINAKNKNEIIRLLNKHRLTTKKSKYC